MDSRDLWLSGFVETTPKRANPEPSNDPIVISDDETDSVYEVARNLVSSRNTRTRSMSMNSDIQLVEKREVIDLSVMSDEEDSARSNSKIPTANLKAKKVAFAQSGTLAPSRALPTTLQKLAPTNLPGPSSRKKVINRGPPSTIVRNTQKLRMKNGYITIDSDSEDSEDEYLHTTAMNPFQHPPPAMSSVHPDEVSVQHQVESMLSRKRRFVDISHGYVPPAPSFTSTTDVYIWDILHEYKLLPYFRPRPRFLSRKRARLGEALDMNHYARTVHFRRAGGSVNGILQHNGQVVVCSNTVGGDMTGDATTDPYNKAGTLISWSKRDPLSTIDLEQGEAENLDRKHYSVHCIAYDPTNNILASSAADDFVRTWTFEDDGDDNPYSKMHDRQYEVRGKPASPHELVFKPGTSILAVGEQRLTIENIPEGGIHTFDLVNKKDQNAHVTGSIAWGSAASSSLIFALSEPVMQDNHRGQHKAFDTVALMKAFDFYTSEAGEAGDALCVDSTGSTAALVTNDGSNSTLRIYDVARKQGTATHNWRLEPFAPEAREVNSMAFSFDGIYLALGREDNCTHVYDSRMLERGVLFDFRHSEAQDSDRNHQFYGVVGIKWVESRSPRPRLGLVTGGNDGCVRLWDPLRAKDEGAIIAQTDSDIAAFNLGDRFQGEHELVVGDSSGALYIMDGHANM
ncbi:WD40-repeat-containing domain protein [Mycena pura]|uniref:WD40-repeat-containing domain protein n=1 Tax=Mycena pura TaxID=153505 RepID=A0AAD6VEE8_9AGAR|nr:WD40-repeat-containing domain protein [Mycena pura]